MISKYQKKYADLHIHSSYSDGTFTPTEIYGYAKKAGIHCVSITDHDTVEGIEEAFNAAKNSDIEFIAGVEFSVNWKKPLHILAYFIDHKNPALLDALKKLQYCRELRIVNIIEKLKKYGLPVDVEELREFIKMKTPGRPHIAQYLFQKRIVKSFDEAFDKYLTVGKPGYVEKEKLPLSKTIDLINSAGGLTVLAHPLSIHDDSAVDELIATGCIEGIEAYYTNHSPNDTAHYLKLAEKYKLFVTGGTDCHGAAKKEIYIGKIKLKYEYIEKMREYYSKKIKRR